MPGAQTYNVESVIHYATSVVTMTMAYSQINGTSSSADKMYGTTGDDTMFWSKDGADETMGWQRMLTHSCTHRPTRLIQVVTDSKTTLSWISTISDDKIDISAITKWRRHF